MRFSIQKRRSLTIFAKLLGKWRLNYAKVFISGNHFHNHHGLFYGLCAHLLQHEPRARRFVERCLFGRVQRASDYGTDCVLARHIHRGAVGEAFHFQNLQSSRDEADFPDSFDFGLFGDVHVSAHEPCRDDFVQGRAFAERSRLDLAQDDRDELSDGVFLADVLRRADCAENFRLDFPSALGIVAAPQAF